MNSSLNEKNMMVYIVLPIYNGEKYFLEQLISIYFQNYKNRFLIIVNDGSMDSSEDIAKKFISDYKLKDKVKIVKKDNGGLNSAITMGLEEVKKLCNINNSNHFVCYCDCDDIWTRDKLAIQVKFMLDHPDCGLSYQDLAIIDESGILKKSSDLRTYWHNESFLYIATVGGYFTATTMMFKAKYINDILPMPLGFHMNQDYRTALILSFLGIKICYIDKPLVYYRNYFSLSKKQKENFFNGRLYYYTFLQERFPEKDISYIIKCNQDWMVNRRKNGKPLLYVGMKLLIKYPKVFMLYFNMQLHKLLVYMKIC